MESAWVLHIFRSFSNDDAELALIALSSPLANLSEVVIGGYEGAPYSIAGFGFYANNQIDDQARMLSMHARKNISQNSFLTVNEWKDVDRKLSEIARLSEPIFDYIIRGDSFIVIALRQKSFAVSKVFLDQGCDPLIENESGEDVFVVLKTQYATLSTQLNNLQEFKKMASSKIVIPSLVEEKLKEEESVLRHFEQMHHFADTLVDNLSRRRKEIDADLVFQRLCQLKNEVSCRLFYA